jgi:hypothetical protein
MESAIPEALLEAALAEHRSRSYRTLADGIGRVDLRKVRGADGREYQIEIEAEWDDRPGGAVRVVGAIDDGSFRTFLPLSAEFIVMPDGRLMGEG